MKSASSSGSKPETTSATVPDETVRVVTRVAAREQRLAQMAGKIRFPEALPVSGRKDEIAAAIAANPDVILVTQQGLQAAGGIEGVLQLPGLASTPAGRAKRVVAMDAPLLLGFGPRLPEAVSQLAERCSAAVLPMGRGSAAGRPVGS